MSEYPLQLSDAELARYRFMAETAARYEGPLWAAAGVVEGAVVADIGCGPGAVSVVLAQLVGPTGRVVAVDRDPAAADAARANAARAEAGNVSVGVGDAYDTGVAPGSVDVVMIRHVLAHNGGLEEKIVAHAASLVRPGGSVYLVDADVAAVRMYPAISDLDDLAARYVRWHTDRGNDLSVGLRLGELLSGAGLQGVDHQGRYDIVPMRPDWRPPSWAAREALVSDGLADDADVERWAAAFEALDRAATRPTVFVPVFVAFGRAA